MKNNLPSLIKLNSLICTLLLIAGSITVHAQRDCSTTSVGFTPITTLGTDTFMGEQGGLYPGGSNVMPTMHTKAGKSIGNSIKPLNAAGEVDFENGVVLFAGFGASTAGNTFNYLKNTIDTSTINIYNPCLKFITCTIGGKGLETMIPPQHNWYWTFIGDSIPESKGFTRDQVQIGWLKTASKTDSVAEFPMQPDSLYAKYIPSIQRLKENFPNLKILYISSHAYGGYAGELSDNAELAGEPAAYYGGFAVKWVIEDQINGSPELKYRGGGTNSPWLSWGPYFWADGLTPRANDGLTWECEDYDEFGGGFHLSSQGLQKEMDMLIDFFMTNSSSKKWFKNGPTWSSCDPSMRLSSSNDPDFNNFYADEISIFPTPNNGNFSVAFYNEDGAAKVLKIVNNQGQEVYEKVIDETKGEVMMEIALQNIPAGLYHVMIVGSEMHIERSIVITK